MILSPRWLFQLSGDAQKPHQSHLKCSYVHKWPQEHCVPPDVPSFCTSGGDSLHRARHVNKLLLLAVQKHHFSRQSTCTHSPYINMHRYTNEFTKLFPARKGTELYEGDSWCITSGLNSLQTLPNKTHTHTHIRTYVHSTCTLSGFLERGFAVSLLRIYSTTTFISLLHDASQF